MLYSFPKLSKYDFGLIRVLGPGLGNLLFPWARSIIANQKYGLTPIAPTWPQIKLGTIIRGETDKRTYFGLFNSSYKDFSLSKKLRLLYLTRKIDEEQFLQIMPAVNMYDNDLVVVFSGIKNGFADLAGYNKLILSSLINIVRNRHLSGYRANLSNGICMHIRLGDFVIGGHGTTSISWYVSIAKAIRAMVGESIPVYVFSDGTDDELSPLLKLCHVQRKSFGSSIADILAMVNTPILVATANSTFSGWVSYLGAGLTIWPSNSRKHGLDSSNSNILELDEDQDILKPVEDKILSVWNR